MSAGGPGAVTTAPLQRAAILLPRVPLDVIRELHRRDALGGLVLPGHLHQRAAARGTRALIGRERVHASRRSGAPVASRGPCPVAATRGLAEAPVSASGRARRHGRLDGERELRDLGLAPQPRELGSQLEIRRDEALILAREQLRDLPQRLDVAFLVQRHHAGAQ